MVSGSESSASGSTASSSTDRARFRTLLPMSIPRTVTPTPNARDRQRRPPRAAPVRPWPSSMPRKTALPLWFAGKTSNTRWTKE